MGKRRILNFRAVLVGMIAFAVFGLVFVGLSRTSAPPVSEYALVATRYLGPGTQLTREVLTTAFTDVELPAGAHGYYGELAAKGLWDPATNIDTTLYPEEWESAVDTMLVNTLYPGDELRKSDVYVPASARCSADARLTTAPGGAALDPVAAATDPAAGPRFAMQFSDLLCDEQRAIVIDGDPVSTFARAGDWVDVFLIWSEPGTADSASGRRTAWLMQRRILYVVDRIVPGDPTVLNDYTPSGTSVILDLDSEDVRDLLFAEQLGTLRIALANREHGDTFGGLTPVDWETFAEKFRLATGEAAGSGSSLADAPVEISAYGSLTPERYAFPDQEWRQFLRVAGPAATADGAVLTATLEVSPPGSTTLGAPPAWMTLDVSDPLLPAVSGTPTVAELGDWGIAVEVTERVTGKKGRIDWILTVSDPDAG